MHRTIEGLRWAEARPSGPWGKPRPRGAKAHGVRYEKALAKALPAAVHGQWFEFIDLHGPGWCQVDFLIQKEEFIFVLEAKYTWVPEGHSQLEKLYKPVVEKVFNKPMYGVVVCKNLVPAMPVPLVRNLGEALECAKRGGSPAMQWFAGPLSPAFMSARASGACMPAHAGTT